jgi:hypothetical protein
MEPVQPYDLADRLTALMAAEELTRPGRRTLAES